MGNFNTDQYARISQIKPREDIRLHRVLGSIIKKCFQSRWGRYIKGAMCIVDYAGQLEKLHLPHANKERGGGFPNVNRDTRVMSQL